MYDFESVPPLLVTPSPFDWYQFEHSYPMCFPTRYLTKLHAGNLVVVGVVVVVVVVVVEVVVAVVVVVVVVVIVVVVLVSQVDKLVLEIS